MTTEPKQSAACVCDLATDTEFSACERFNPSEANPQWCECLHTEACHTTNRADPGP